MTKTKIAVGALAAASLFLAACTSDGANGSAGETATSPAADGDARTPAVTTATTAADAAETRGAEPRLAISHDGGVMVLDAGNPRKGEKPEVLADLPAKGYLRLNDAGDGRHVFVSSDRAFRALDLGSYSKPHGDHSHHYAGDPVFTGFEVAVSKPGHVVAGDGKAVLFDDETGDLKLVDLGTSHTFRSLGMNDDGLGVVLGTDGKLHVVDLGGENETLTADLPEMPDEILATKG